ncbi:MAG: replicative DNA helicase [Candidatus Kerfeldbacteria bacterium]|nr:replicative DNA helicase [Candidatus Kerfeldbacteria bacterium]
MATDQLEKVPPQNVEAEQSVLGSLLIDKEAIVKIADIIRPDDFYKETHRKIFEAMLELYEKREPIDVLSLTNRLKERTELEIIGGRAYLAQLTNAVPTSSHVVSYAEIVQHKATLRRLLSAAASISELGFKETEDVAVVLDQAERTIFDVSQKYLRQQFIPLKTVLTEAFDRIDELHRQPGKLRGVATGLRDLDNILAGLQKGDLIILASRPSVGKTSLALDIARNVAVREKVPVGLFSLEMSKEQLVDRLLVAEAGVDLWKMRTGKLSEDEDFSRIGHAMGVLSETPIFIDDSAISTVLEMRTKARRLQSEHGLGLVVVDYLQLMEGRAEAENRVLQIAEITRGLKGLAKELNVPVLALSQLSRATEMRNPPIPKLSDLRESGSIEQDADVVVFIYREEIYRPDTNRKHIADLLVSKHRNGPTGQVQAFFDEAKTSFHNLEKDRQEPPF